MPTIGKLLHTIDVLVLRLKSSVSNIGKVES
jgi:hypothetical protein